MALAPQTADAGPRTTSICLISRGLVGTRSHMTMPKKSRYTLRPSTSANCEVESVDVAPRVVMFTSRAETCVTFMPGTARSRSPTLVAGDVSIVAVLMTLTAAGAFTRWCSESEAVTATSYSEVGGLAESCEGCWADGCWGCWPWANTGTANATNVATAKRRAIITGRLLRGR